MPDVALGASTVGWDGGAVVSVAGTDVALEGRDVRLGAAPVGGGAGLMAPSASASERPPTTSTTEIRAYNNPPPSWRRELMAWRLSPSSLAAPPSAEAR